MYTEKIICQIKKGERNEFLHKCQRLGYNKNRCIGAM
nr:MAG TPA: hypothetical protein [Siphoviridae sp. ctqcj14]